MPRHDAPHRPRRSVFGGQPGDDSHPINRLGDFQSHDLSEAVRVRSAFALTIALDTGVVLTAIGCTWVLDRAAVALLGSPPHPMPLRVLGLVLDVGLLAMAAMMTTFDVVKRLRALVLETRALFHGRHHG